MIRQSVSGCCSLNSKDSILAASPIISMFFYYAIIAHHILFQLIFRQISSMGL